MSIQETKHRIEELLAPTLADKGAFLVDLQVRSERRGTLVQLFVDTDAGITIDECAEISRQFARVLELNQPIDGAYNLEVSSPGIERPLKFLRQYAKNVGRKFRVRYKSDANKAELSSLTGTLERVSDDRLTFVPDKGEPLTLSFSQIIESKEELPW